jgi:hypothetical protein
MLTNTLHLILVYPVSFPEFGYSKSRLGSESIMLALGPAASGERARNFVLRPAPASFILYLAFLVDG